MALIKSCLQSVTAQNVFKFIVPQIEAGNANYGSLDLSKEQLSGYTQITIEKTRGDGSNYANEYRIISSNGSVGAGVQITPGTAFNIPSLSDGEFVHIYWRCTFPATGNSNEYTVTLS